jgi:hypothetical protein
LLQMDEYCSHYKLILKTSLFLKFNYQINIWNNLYMQLSL